MLQNLSRCKSVSLREQTTSGESGQRAATSKPATWTNRNTHCDPNLNSRTTPLHSSPHHGNEKKTSKLGFSRNSSATDENRKARPRPELRESWVKKPKTITRSTTTTGQRQRAVEDPQQEKDQQQKEAEPTHSARRTTIVVSNQRSINNNWTLRQHLRRTAREALNTNQTKLNQDFEGKASSTATSSTYDHAKLNCKKLH